MEEFNKKLGLPPHKADRYTVSSGRLLPVHRVAVHVGRIRAQSNRGLEQHLVKGKYHYAHAFVAILRIVYPQICGRDAEKALTTAQKYTVSRLAARTGVYILRGKLELFGFKILNERS
jgi:hypothetical protein